MTLFTRTAEPPSVFDAAPSPLFAGRPDDRTLALLDALQRKGGARRVDR